MSLLATIAGLLALVLLLIGVLGLLAPRLFRNKTTGEVPRRMQLLPGIAIMVVLLLIIAGWADDRAATAAPAEPANPATAAPSAKPTLGLTPQAYAANFNALALAAEAQPGALSGVTAGPVNDTAQFAIDPNRAVVLIIDKRSGAVSSVFFIGSGQGTFASGADVLIGAILAMQAGLPAAERAGVADAMTRRLRDVEPDGPAVEIPAGAAQVTMSLSPVTGFNATLGLAED